MIAGFIAAQGTDFGVPHAVACRALSVRGLNDLELATLEWVDWLNHRRIHHHNPGRVPPAEAEDLHYRQQHSAHRAGTQTKQPA